MSFETSNTKTLDNSTYASDPGRIRLSDEKLREMRPELYKQKSCWSQILDCLDAPAEVYLQEHLQYGDSRAAVVVSTSPLLVAAYTDELDCIAMLKFDEERHHFVKRYKLKVGSRLLTVNTYKNEYSYDKDLILGPNMIKRWSGFIPVIADFLTEDKMRLEVRKKQIAEEEWKRTLAMGTSYMNKYPGVWRQGRPAAGRHSQNYTCSCCPASLKK